MWISTCRRGLSRRVRGPKHVATLLLQVRRGTVLLVAIGAFRPAWGGETLSGIRATLRHVSLKNIGLQ